MFKIYKFKLLYKEGEEIKEENVTELKWGEFSIESVNGKLYNAEAHIIVQFANCFDKLGVPIFQGSILKNETGIFFDVIAVDGNFAIVVGEEVVYLINSNARNFEVVGDIFKNPELIEKPIDMDIFNKESNEETK